MNEETKVLIKYNIKKINMEEEGQIYVSKSYYEEVVTEYKKRFGETDPSEQKEMLKELSSKYQEKLYIIRGILFRWYFLEFKIKQKEESK